MKGGAGCSTVAASVALTAAARDRRVALIARDAEEAAALLGVSTGEGERAYQVTPNLDLLVMSSVSYGEDFGGEYERVVFDYGREVPGDVLDAAYLVLRGPCYLGLRKAARAGYRPNGVVIVGEAGRSIGEREVSDVLGVPVVAEVPVDPSVARSIDAGLFSSRVPRVLTSKLGMLAGAGALLEAEVSGLAR